MKSSLIVALIFFSENHLLRWYHHFWFPSVRNFSCLHFLKWSEHDTLVTRPNINLLLWHLFVQCSFNLCIISPTPIWYVHHLFGRFSLIQEFMLLYFKTFTAFLLSFSRTLIDWYIFSKPQKFIKSSHINNSNDCMMKDFNHGYLSNISFTFIDKNNTFFDGAKLR